MHLERNILKGKFGKNKELKKEAREELAEKKGGMAKKMTSREAVAQWKKTGKKPKGLHKVGFPSEWHKRDTSTDF